MLNSRAVAEQLDVDASTVTRWCRARKLAGAEQHAGRWHIPSSALDGFIRPARGRPKGRDRRWNWPVRAEPPIHDCALAQKALGHPAAARRLDHAWQCPSCGALWQDQ